MKRFALAVFAMAALFATPALAQTKKALNFDQLAPSKINTAGTWWRDAKYAAVLGLTVDQQKQMDGVFQEFRIKLLDLNHSLEREEAILEPLMEAERIDASKVLPQVDRVAEARAELEKTNARMLLGIRQVMTVDQWSQLQAGSIKKADLKTKLKAAPKK